MAPFIGDREDGAFIGKGGRSPNSQTSTEGLAASLRADDVLIDVRQSDEITNTCAATTSSNMGRWSRPASGAAD